MAGRGSKDHRELREELEKPVCPCTIPISHTRSCAMQKSWKCDEEKHKKTKIVWNRTTMYIRCMCESFKSAVLGISRQRVQTRNDARVTRKARETRTRWKRGGCSPHMKFQQRIARCVPFFPLSGNPLGLLTAPVRLRPSHWIPNVTPRGIEACDASPPLPFLSCVTFSYYYFVPLSISSLFYTISYSTRCICRPYISRTLPFDYYINPSGHPFLPFIVTPHRHHDRKSCKEFLKSAIYCVIIQWIESFWLLNVNTSSFELSNLKDIFKAYCVIVIHSNLFQRR